MTDPKNLKVRVKKARAAQYFAQPMKKDYLGNVTVVRVPGSGGKYYQVILRRLPTNLMTVECGLEAGTDGHIPCRGNGSGSTCVHGLAAVIVAGEDKGFSTTWSAAGRR